MNAKILKVIEPMFSLLPGDILELTDDGTSYVAEISDSDFNELEVVSATLKISASCVSSSISGQPSPRSHFETALSLMFIFLAS